ncbi:MAG: hypothetical protein HOP30_13410 [Cyclobacteriaceae bacterium]|nr:hypothetical protein [Cyclobacteriaceae bacterium]
MKKILDIVRIPATILGGLGLIYIIYIHLNAIDYADVSGDKIPGYLTTGLFAIWATAIGVGVMRQKELKVENPDFGTKLKIFYKSLFGEAPTLVIIISVATFLYGNYYGWTYNFEGITGIIDGKMVLHNHGQIIKELTEAEFLQYEAEHIRLTTSNSMMFYGVGTGILFPRLKKIES